MIGTELTTWMDAARIGPREMARRLAANGHTVSPQRVSQWRKGERISEYWQTAIAQVVAQVDAEDRARIA